MEKRNVDFFWEHPTRFIVVFILFVVAFCVLLTIMPEWFRAVCGILFAWIVIKKIIAWEKKQE